MSVYPYWDKDAGLEQDLEGTLRDFTANLVRLSKKYGCETMVVETGTEAAKPQEGKQVMQAIIDAALNKTQGHCHGVFYWAPELEGHRGCRPPGSKVGWPKAMSTKSREEGAMCTWRGGDVAVI